MAGTFPGVLARIAGQKQEELKAKRSQEEALTSRAFVMRSGRRDFAASLCAQSPAFIAEIKKASPSKGLLTDNFQPAIQAQAYEAGGAACLSVLTDSKFFQGSLIDLREARQACKLPVLRKDFTVDDLDVIEAAAWGADAILLIAAMLDTSQMQRFRRLAENYGMTALVEVHNEAELENALASGARLVGVNNRDLHTFQVDLSTSIRLANKIPEDRLRVAESGIHSADDVHRLRDAGYHAFLVGEHLMKSTDPSAALKALAG